MSPEEVFRELSGEVHLALTAEAWNGNGIDDCSITCPTEALLNHYPPKISKVFLGPGQYAWPDDPIDPILQFGLRSGTGQVLQGFFTHSKAE